MNKVEKYTLIATLILILLASCGTQATPTEVFEVTPEATVVVSAPTLQPIEAESLPTQTEPPLPTETSTSEPTVKPTAEPTEAEATEEVVATEESEEMVEVPDMEATYQAIATDRASRLETMMTGVNQCELAPRVVGWRDYRIDEIGLSMQLPVDWYDQDYRTFSPRELSMFRVGDYGVANSSAVIHSENIEINVWLEEEMGLVAFIKEMRAWAADKEGIHAMLYSPLPHVNATVNGHPASISYVPEYNFGEYSYPAKIVTVTKINDYVIQLIFEPRKNYDPTETLTKLLSSLTIDGAETGETTINKTVGCQMILNSCLSQCHFDMDELQDESVFRP